MVTFMKVLETITIVFCSIMILAQIAELTNLNSKIRQKIKKYCIIRKS